MMKERVFINIATMADADDDIFLDDSTLRAALAEDIATDDAMEVMLDVAVSSSDEETLEASVTSFVDDCKSRL